MKNEVENLLARMSCTQSDVFSCLREYIKVYSADKKLRKISTQKYSDTDNTKSVVGIDGELVYGVVSNYDPAKRDRIVKQIKRRIERCDEPCLKCSEMMRLAMLYIDLQDCMKNIYEPEALKFHIDRSWNLMNKMYERIHKYSNQLN